MSDDTRGASTPGFGAMIQQFGGNRGSAEAFSAATGKTISRLWLDPDGNGGDGALKFRFTDGTGVELFDSARACSESRWLHTDDDLDYFVGATLTSAEVVGGKEVADDYDIHEWAFLIVETNRGKFTVETHNMHNGYYDGICVRCRALEPESKEQCDEQDHGGAERGG